MVNKTIMSKFYFYISIAIIIVLFGRLAPTLYHRWVAIDAYTQESDALVDSPIYQTGDTIHWKVTLCKHHDYNFYSQRTLVNAATGQSYPILEISTKSTLAKGQCGEVNPSTVIPLNSNRQPGTYYLCSEIVIPKSERKVNPFRYCTNKFYLQ